MTDPIHRRGSERRPVALQVRLAYGDLGEFVDRYAINISDGGIFIRSREPRPVGSRLKFELHLRTGEVVFAGEGTVRWRELPDARGLGVAGMGLQFDHLTDESREVLSRILELREVEHAPPAVEGATPSSWQPIEDFPVPVDSVPEMTPVRRPPTLSPELAGEPDAVVTPPASAAFARVRLVSKGAAIGIDFGWSTIRVATAQGDRSRVLDLCGGRGLPSLLADVGDRWVVGAEASQAVRRGARGIRGISHLLGRWGDAPALKSWTRRQLTGVALTEDGRAGVLLAGQVVPAEAAAEALLRSVKAAVELQLRGPILRVAFAVPSGWTDAQRRALRRAAQAVDLPVEEFVSAPIASALACHGTRGKRRLLTVQFGEGGFEAAVVEQAGHVFDVVASALDLNLGGADLDTALLESVLMQFERESGLFVPEDYAVFERVRAASAEAKEALNDALEYDIILTNLVEAGLSKADLHQRVSRARLLQLAVPMIDRAVEVARAALQGRGLGGADLDEILLFGGQARLGALARKLAEKLGREPARPDTADDAAAVGAALVADGATQLGRYVIAGAVGNSVVIGLPGGGVKRIIDRNLPLPIERGYTIANALDGQKEIELHLFQGDSPRAFENEYLGALVVGPLLPLPKGEARIALTLGLNEGGELNARGRDVATGRPINVLIDRQHRPEAARKSLLPRG
jgi:molecular chaperone DnaK